jgi:hypothetical protein
MEPTPLTQWKCDKCGETVTAANGYVIWNGTGSPSNFKIIHQGRCDDKSVPYSQPLKDFLGPNGLAHITSMMSYGPVSAGQGVPKTPHADDYIDFLRRVQLPFYEEARAAFADRDVREDLSDANQTYPYLQEVMKRLASRKLGAD